jgi:nicotinamide-nucleotide amidase
MNAEIITIGDEILIGQIIDTNSAFLGKQLNTIGVEVVQITSIRDEKDIIIKALEDAETRADIIITTGGLGPTKDDLTKHTLCEYFKDELVLDQSTLDHIEDIFKKYINHPILEANRSQAYLPSKCIALKNPYGTAPGMWFEQEGKVFISMPGVPFEMKSLVNNEVLPRLKDRFNRPFIFHKTVLTYGLGESAIADKIEDWENKLPKFIKLAYLPSLGRVRLRLSARGDNAQLLQDEIKTQVEKLHDYIGDIIKGYEDENTIEENIAKGLTKKGLSLATAESCTGGRLAAKFTEIPGASAYFKGSIVSYATSAKHDVLNISKDFIEKHSVVSAEITKEMAIRVKKMFKSDVAIATTGNAGPTKGDSDAEIGTVFIALAYGNEVKVEKFNFGNHRERVTQKAVNKALEMLYDFLND